ncbi:MAG: hypothetical protein JW955_17070 [Sedimentisphaerales bacterium]|nr:hypothetical protein [Sedimentisphaerales bacterium]
MTSVRRPPIRREAGTARAILYIGTLLFAAAVSGCSTLEYVQAEYLPYEKLAFPYDHTHLKTSATLDVLNLARAPEYQLPQGKVEEVLLTQSDTAVAFSGRNKDRRKSWVTLVVFDEYRLTAKRKYFFLVDERAEAAPDSNDELLIPQKPGVVFDSEFVIDPEILTTPYATEEAQRAAMVRWLTEQYQKDVTALMGSFGAPARGSAVIATAAMMMRQTFTGLLVELDKSPGLAGKLADAKGVEFPHMSMKKGRARLLTHADLAALTLRVNFPMPPLPAQ